MVRIDCLIFGYRKLRIDPSDVSTATALLLRAGVPSHFNSDGTITIRERDYVKMRSIFKGRIEFSPTEPLGLYGNLKKIKYKRTVALAIAFSVLLTLFSSLLVWDIRVDGNENIPSAGIVFELSRCGFEIGDFWFSKNKSKVETTFLLNSPNVSWININKRGTVAYVKIIEKENDETDPYVDTTKYANIIADSDCVIEEITVTSGYAVVKAGDVVKKGDLLISGALPNDIGGGFCVASGIVVGRISDTISAEVSREYICKEEKNSKLCSLSLDLFNFSVNIFKLYGNFTNECDIIEHKKNFSLSVDAKLPFSILSTYLKQYVIQHKIYTDEELVSVASSRLSSLVTTRLATADLVKIRTYGFFTETGYIMSSDVIFLTDVGEILPFEVN